MESALIVQIGASLLKDTAGVLQEEVKGHLINHMLYTLQKVER